MISTALVAPALALITLVGASAPQSLPAAVASQPVEAASFDPDPADCPFCGGNPTLHIQRLFQIERVSLALSTSLLR